MLISELFDEEFVMLVSFSCRYDGCGLDSVLRGNIALKYYAEKTVADKFPCTSVDMTFFESAPFIYTAEEVINVSADTVFQSFENAEDWPVWAAPIQRVEWTSPQPFGIGTTRTVYMMGGLTGYEEFIAWERGREMAFCFTHSSKDNIVSFAERYQVEESGPNCCCVRWTMAMKPKGFSRYFLPVFSPFMNMGVKLMLRNLRKLLEKRAA